MISPGISPWILGLNGSPGDFSHASPCFAHWALQLLHALTHGAADQALAAWRAQDLGCSKLLQEEWATQSPDTGSSYLMDFFGYSNLITIPDIW